jgi:hypothetical protein
MKRLTLGMCILVSVVLTISPLAAQSRGASSGGDAGRGAATAAASTSYSSAGSSAAVSYYSTSGGGSYAAPIGDRAFGAGTGTGSGYYGSPNLQGTSFITTNYYYSWNDYFSYLYRYFDLSPTYYSRFYKNREPLMTPAMLKMTLRQPLFISTEMLKSIDQLEIMLRDSLAGKAVDKEALIAKSQAIRKLAKQIRQNPTLSMIDIRKETDLYKENSSDALSLESIGKLREMALDLNRQLTDMHAMSSSSTISVDSYQEPSFQSVAKGIERVCKAIESSSKKL